MVKKRAGAEGERPRKYVSLKTLADYVHLAPATVSLVMNRSPVADTIPKRTKDLIFEAAAKLHYRPNFLPRSLRSQRSFTIGVLVPEVSEGYAALVMSGIEDHLLQQGYFYFVASHRHRSDLIDEYPKLLLCRSVDGIIGVDTPWSQSLPIPVVKISGRNEVRNVTNVVLGHDLAADLALRHLYDLGVEIEFRVDSPRSRNRTTAPVVEHIPKPWLAAKERTLTRAPVYEPFTVRTVVIVWLKLPLVPLTVSV